MFAHHANEDYTRAVAFKWLLLAFAAGAMNAGGYLACSRFVTHVTGFATLFGIDIASGHAATALGILSVPAYFMLGAMISGFFIDVRLARAKPPRYGLVLAMISGLLLIAAIGGHFRLFGMFDGTFQIEESYILLVVLCLASGLQNAVVTSASGMAVRTTHLTGATTDVGIGLARTAFGKLTPAQRRQELKRITLRLGTIGSFGSGGVVGALAFIQLQYLGFLLPLVVIVYVAFVAKRASRLPRCPSTESCAPFSDQPNDVSGRKHSGTK